MRRHLPHRSRLGPGRAAAALAVLAASAGWAGPLGAQEVDDPFQARQEAQDHIATLADELEQLEATNAELQAVVLQLKAQVEAQEAALEFSRSALLAATKAAEQAAEDERQKAREVLDLEARMRQMAVETYLRPPGHQRLSIVLEGGDLNDLSRALVFFDAKFSMDLQIAQELELARQQLEVNREIRRRAVTRAAARSDVVAAALTELETSKKAYEDLVALVELRMGQVDFERAAYYAVTVELNSQIEERQRRIMAAAMRDAGRGSVPLVNVRGIMIHASIAQQLEAMLAAAERDGIVLGGGGFRSFEAQIATRRNNCGGDDPYTLFEKPPGECSPPTARPGTSMHELGLAIDFTHNGSIISTRNSPAFAWLAANAAAYGLYNLPSEPWHWSTTGS